MLSKAFTKLVLLAVAITLLTVGYQAIKAAPTNPVTALQYEWLMLCERLRKIRVLCALMKSIVGSPGPA
jgi:hypothetical protein